MFSHKCGSAVSFQENVQVAKIDGCILLKLFRWQPSLETLLPFAAGLVVIGLSFAMMAVKEIAWLGIVIRDIFQVFLVGIVFPLAYIRLSGNEFADFGLNLKNWYIFLPINLMLGAVLFLVFLLESPLPADFKIIAAVLWKAAYVMCALFFELLFFYGFLRTLFERSFGVVSAVVLTALFYAFHHIGFQPEYGKLIFVGLMYTIVYRLGKSALLIFPFFLGVGGVYDALIQSEVVAPILFPKTRALYLSFLILVTLAWTWKEVKSVHAQCDQGS